MRYSIIIPCYNSSLTIVRALESLDKQNFFDYEVLIVDDCSKDNTAQVVEQYVLEGHDNVKILRNEKNVGPGESRNRALKQVQGEYVAFIDSDDYVSSDYFTSINQAIEEKGGDLIYIGCQQVFGEKKRFILEDNLNSKEDYIALASGSLCKIVASSRIWEGVTLPALTSAEDIAVIPYLFSKANNIVSVQKPLYNYVYNSLSISSRPKASTVQNFIDSYEITKKMVSSREYKEALEFHGIKTILYGAILNALMIGLPQSLIHEIIMNFKAQNPNWITNKFVSRYSRRKRFFLSFVNRDNIVLLRIYVFVHKMYLKLHG